MASAQQKATSAQHNKVAFVTGAASGIALATAEALIKRGYATVLVDRNETAGYAAEARLREYGKCAFVAADVTDEHAVKNAVEFAIKTYDRLDVAFNAAGLDGAHAMTADCTTENWNRVIAVNLTGVWNCLRHQIPQMLKTGGGSIVNCASVAGIVGAPYLPAYVAAKHGVVGLTKASALEYARQGIRINAICPAFIDTPLSRESLTPEHAAALQAELPIGRFAQAEEVASMVQWLLSDDCSFVTGQAIAIDGAWTAR
jgi:NAD(P)-dependent dehydrogenase (short-subunit alcohol dehydrogenase family)